MNKFLSSMVMGATLFSGLFIFPAYGAEKCGKEADYSYCVFSPAEKGNGEIIYFFHGIRGDEHSWGRNGDFARKLEEYWRSRGVKPPTIVSVSFGPAWLFSPRMTLPRSGLLPKFREEILPRIEKDLPAPKKRIVFGLSMGGLNALILGLSSPGFFQKIAALCAGVYAEPLFDPEKAPAVAERLGLPPKSLTEFASLAGQFASTSAEWERIAPLSLVEKFGGRGTKFYLWAGRRDRHGNFRGTAELARRARERGFSVRWVPADEGHCTGLDIPSLAKFLVE